MYTCCPHCQAVFHLLAPQLTRAGGKVRCGECRRVYQATDYLFDDLDAVQVARDTAETEIKVVETPAPDLEPPLDYVKETGEGPAGEDEVLPPVSPVAWDRPTFSAGQVLGGILAVCLLLSLGAQWAWFNRDALAMNDDWRPLLEPLCEVAHCALPLRADTRQLAIISRDVRQHPSVDNALLINAAFENRADFVQPFPVVEISFSDSTGAAVAGRRFRPDEYLGDRARIGQGIPAHSPVRLVLEVMDPGEQAVSYQFSFL